MCGIVAGLPDVKRSVSYDEEKDSEDKKPESIHLLTAV